MEITGKIIAVLEARGGVSQRSGLPWKSQEFVIETIEQYPKRCCFTVHGEDKLNGFDIKKDEKLTVFFDINAREWQGRWFNEVNAWKVERDNTEANMADTTVHGVADEQDPFSPEMANQPF